MFPSEDTRIRLLKKFQAETTKNIDILRGNLPVLCDINNKDIINAMFMAAHTIKGNAGMMQLLDEHMVDFTAPASELEEIMLTLRNQQVIANKLIAKKIEFFVDQLESLFALSKE